MKICRSCGQTKPHNAFYFSLGRYRHPCKDCSRKNRLSINGIINQRWLGIQQRTNGVTKNHSTAFGKKCCTKKEFFEWSMKSTEFRELYDNWVKAGFNRDKSPSIDRIDISKGYVLNNIQWLTMRENNIKGHKDHTYSYGRKKVRLTQNGKEMVFNSGKEASFYFKKNRLAVTNNIRMGHKIHGWECAWI